MNLSLIKRITILITLLLPVAFYTDAQTRKLNNLRDSLAKETIPSRQLELIFSICEEHVSFPADSLLKYISLAEKIASPGSPEYFKTRSFYGVYLSKTNKAEQSVELIDSLLRTIPDEKEYENVFLRISGNKCNALMRNNKTKEAIEQTFKVLQKAEQLHDTLWMVRAYIILGWAQMELSKYEDAIVWLNKGIRYTGSTNIIRHSSYLFSNIASCYNNIGRQDSALHYIELALKYSRQDENLSVEANALNIRADIYLHQGNYAAAENDMREALRTRELIGDMLYVVSDMAQLSNFYASINQTDKGIEVAQKGIELARKANNLSKLLFLYNALAENYKKANRTSEYAASLATIIGLKDSLYEKNSEDAIAAMGAKYELQKKENIIIQQENQLLRNRYFNIGLIVFLVLVLLLSLVLYRNYKLVQQRKMANMLAEQKKLATEAVQAAEENERKRIAADLHDNLGAYAAAITANVKYLKESTTNSNDGIVKQLDENAQSMVTQLSDTIWVLKNEYLPITKLADRFKVWMQRLMMNYPAVKYHYAENIIDDVEFTPAKILHIFLMLKECVNNALKHSNGTDLKINFFSHKNWTITIEDNGKGFELNQQVTGSGIENIRNRAKECGWNVEWRKVIPAGVRVVISDSTTK